MRATINLFICLTFFCSVVFGQVPPPSSLIVKGATNGTGIGNVSDSLKCNVTNTVPVSGTFWQTTQPVSGTFYQATQPVSGTFWQTTQPVSGTLTCNAGTNLNTSLLATSANQSTELGYLSTLASNVPILGQATMSASQPVVIASNQSAVPISGSISNTSFAATQSTASSLNMTDATGTNIQGTVAAGTAASKSALAGQVYSSTVPTVPNGQQIAMQSDPYGNHLVISPDLYITGQSAQTATVNNIIPATAGANATDALGYHSATVQLIAPAGTYTTGAVIFEGSNDNVNFQTIPVYSQLLTTGVPIVAAITLVTTTSLVYTFPIQTRYIRVRISTAISGASAQVQAFTKLSVAAWAPAAFQVANNTAANLATTATIASGTVTTVSSVTALAAVNTVATTNGMTIGDQITAATPVALQIKASAGRLHFIHVGNPNTTAVYLKLFNATSVTLGTTSAAMNFYIPASSSLAIPISDQGLYFGTGIGLAVTGGASLTDNTGITTGCEVNYSYL